MSETQRHLEAHLAKLRTMSQSKVFLGREFLTWVWYQSEVQNEPMLIVHPRSQKNYLIDLWVDDRVTLESPTGKVHSHILKGGDPSQSAEAAAALMTGKTPKEIKLGMTIHDFGEFVFTLAGDDIAPRSIHLPEPSENLVETENFSPISFRLAAIEALGEVIDGLFSLFMDERVDESRFGEFRQKLKDWIRARPTGQDSLLH